MWIDRLGIAHEDSETAPDYGGLALIRQGRGNINVYSGVTFDGVDSDAVLLYEYITAEHAAPGSVCFFREGQTLMMYGNGHWGMAPPDCVSRV